jgi:hypothetical protein
MWTAVFGAITPLVLLFSLWVQRIWAEGVAKAATKAAAAAVDVKNAAFEVKQKLEETSNEQRVSMAIIQQTTSRTYIKVDGQFTLYLKNMALLARNHATMARGVAKASLDPKDESVAVAAEFMAISTEADYQSHLEKESANLTEGNKQILEAQAVEKGSTHARPEIQKPEPVEHLGTIEVIRTKEP